MDGQARRQALQPAEHSRLFSTPRGPAFQVQNKLARTLAAELTDSEHHVPLDRVGFDALFTARYDTFSSQQTDDHRVIRGYTEHALRPINARMSTWLRNDIDSGARLSTATRPRIDPASGRGPSQAR